jgi:hypothetical protein
MASKKFDGDQDLREKYCRDIMWNIDRLERYSVMISILRTDQKK